MKIIQESNERTWYLIEEFTTKAGLLARVHQCVWKVESPSLKPFYTGYVQIPDGIKIEDTAELNVHGGITFGYPQPKELTGAIGLWTGFDLAHVGDENIQVFGYVVRECERLAEQITNK